MGKYEKAVEEAENAIRLNPDFPIGYVVLMVAYISLNRLDLAKATYEQALERKLDFPPAHIGLYQIAFLQNDVSGMAQQIAWSAGKPSAEDELLGLEADTAAYFGRLRKRASFPARRWIPPNGRKKRKRLQHIPLPLRCEKPCSATPAERGNAPQYPDSPGRDVQYGAALALAYAGEYGRAQELGQRIGQGFPEDTLVQFNYLPTLRAKIAVSNGNASQAIESLRVVTPYELGQTTSSVYGWTALYPVYVRGEAHLGASRQRSRRRVPENSRPSRNCGERAHRSTRASSDSPAPMPCKATPPKPKRRIRISSRSGKTPTPTSPS